MVWIPGRKATTYISNRGDAEAGYLLLFFEDSPTKNAPHPSQVVPR